MCRTRLFVCTQWSDSCVCVCVSVYVCKLADGEKPLFLRLVAGPDSNMLGFVLREQQSGEVMVGVAVNTKM